MDNKNRNTEIESKDQFVENFSKSLSELLILNEEKSKINEENIIKSSKDIYEELGKNIKEMEDHIQECGDSRENRISDLINDFQEKILKAEESNSEYTQDIVKNTIKTQFEAQKSTIEETLEAYQNSILKSVTDDYDLRVKKLVNMQEKLKRLVDDKNELISKLVNRCELLNDRLESKETDHLLKNYEIIDRLKGEYENLDKEEFFKLVADELNNSEVRNNKAEKELDDLKKRLERVYNVQVTNQLFLLGESQNLLDRAEKKHKEEVEKNINLNRRYVNLMERYIRASDKVSVYEREYYKSNLSLNISKELISVEKEIEKALNLEDVDTKIEVDEEAIKEELKKINYEEEIKPISPHQRGKRKHILTINKKQEEKPTPEEETVDISEENKVEFIESPNNEENTHKKDGIVDEIEEIYDKSDEKTKVKTREELELQKLEIEERLNEVKLKDLAYKEIINGKEA